MYLIEQLIYFFSFQNETINTVLIGSALLGLSAGAVGTFVVLSKKSLVVDSVSHSMLPGIYLGFLLSGTKNPLVLITGGIITGSLSLGMVNYILKKSNLKQDAAIAISLSFWFALGVLSLGLVQQFGNSNQSGLNDFLFGKAASMLESDLYTFAGLSLVSLSTLILFSKHLKLQLFDPIFANTIGISSRLLELISTFLIIITTAAGVQTVGIVLMAAMIIAPTASALLWTNSFEKTIILASIVGVVGAITGVFISYLAPNMPTGPWIVVSLSVIAIVSILLSPKGMLKRHLQDLKNKRIVRQENLLKKLYKKTIETGSSESFLNEKKTVNELKKKNLVIGNSEKLRLTEKGVIEAKRIVRIHRLWELYLQKYLQLPSQHVHNSAESMEHIITPEIEKVLVETMGRPTSDPHEQEIPYN